MLDDIPFLDDATRPRGPALPDATDAHRASGRHLAAIHRMHLAELRGVRGPLERYVAAAGTDENAGRDLEARLEDLAMRDNIARFGTVCGQACQMLSAHHTIEDRAIFPALARHEAMREVVARLAAEHLTVHALIERLVETARAAIAKPAPENLAALRETYDALERVILSHFGYEERELETALGYFGVDL